MSTNKKKELAVEHLITVGGDLQFRNATGLQRQYYHVLDVYHQTLYVIIIKHINLTAPLWSGMSKVSCVNILFQIYTNTALEDKRRASTGFRHRDHSLHDARCHLTGTNRAWHLGIDSNAYKQRRERERKKILVSFWQQFSSWSHASSHWRHSFQSQPHPLHFESRTNVTTLIPCASRALISFRARAELSLPSWQTFVFTIFFSQANKRGAVIASDYMKNCLMIPIYNPTLNNDTFNSWQLMMNGNSYKADLRWRTARDELHADTNPR